MATMEQHRRLGETHRDAYLADKRCDSCGRASDLALVYRKRWWVEVGVTMWSQPKGNLRTTLSRSRVVCRPCIATRTEQIRSVLLSGAAFDHCQEPDCPLAIAGRGFCTNHRYAYMQLTGVQPRRMAPRGAGRINHDGYRILYLPGHPNANRYGRIAEHRKVMADKLGRPLRPEESPHHKNGVRSDNRPENLELWVKPQPPGQRASDLVAWAEEIISRYGEEVRSGIAL